MFANLANEAAHNHHEQVPISLLSKALSRIGDALSCVPSLGHDSYPTERSAGLARRRSSAQCIFEFFKRAHKWHQEGWRRHLYWHCFTQPPKLQYKDLLDDITDNSNRRKELSDSRAQTELREIHGKVMDIQAALALQSSVSGQYQHEAYRPPVFVLDLISIAEQHRRCDAKLISITGCRASGGTGAAYLKESRIASGSRRSLISGLPPGNAARQ